MQDEQTIDLTGLPDDDIDLSGLPDKNTDIPLMTSRSGAQKNELVKPDQGGEWIDDPVLGKTFKSSKMTGDRKDDVTFSLDTTGLHNSAANLASHLPRSLQWIGGALLDLPVSALDTAAGFLSDPTAPATGFLGNKKYGVSIKRELDEVPKTAEVKTAERVLERAEKPRYRANLDGTFTKIETPTRQLETKKFITPDENVPMMGAVGQSTYPRPSRAQNPTNPVDILWRRLSEAKKLNKEQRVKLAAERGQRFGEAEKVAGTGFEYLSRARGKLSGEYSKARFEPLGLDDATMNSLAEIITETPGLHITERVRAGDALTKMVNGIVPQRNEVQLLNKVFSPHIPGRRSKTAEKLNIFNEEPFSDLLYRYQPKGRRAADEFNDISKTLMSSMDMSAFRQGLPLSHKKAFWTSIDDMIKGGFSQKFYDTMKNDIAADPDFSVLQKSGLALGDHQLGRFAKAHGPLATWVGQIPGIQHSQRAFDAFLMRLRFDASKKMLADMRKLGHNEEEAAHYVSKFVNTSTGYGDLKSLPLDSELLGHVLFSPRYTASRWEMLNPMFYLNQPKGMRTEPLKNAMTILGVIGTANGLGYMFNKGLESDPKSSDFGKVQIGKTRIDPGNGFLQNIVLMNRLVQQARRSANGPNGERGKLREFGGGFTDPTSLDVVGQYLENKLAPALGLTVAGLRGHDFKGDKLDMKTETAKKFIPIFVQDMYELIQDENKDKSKWIAAPLNFTGLGSSQVYN